MNLYNRTGGPKHSPLMIVSTMERLLRSTPDWATRVWIERGRLDTNPHGKPVIDTYIWVFCTYIDVSIFKTTLLLQYSLIQRESCGRGAFLISSSTGVKANGTVWIASRGSSLNIWLYTHVVNIWTHVGEKRVQCNLERQNVINCTCIPNGSWLFFTPMYKMAPYTYSHTNTQDTHAPFLFLDLHLMHTSIQQNNIIHARRVPATGAHTSTNSLVNAAPSSIYEMEEWRQRSAAEQERLTKRTGIFVQRG